MLGSLYVIKNLINNKVYIGKTYKSLEIRFKQHINESVKEYRKHRPLYKAICRYGADKFYIELLGQFDEKQLELEEIKAIKEYDSFENGYNATLGGDGKRYLSVSDTEILKLYSETKTIRETAKQLNISVDSVSLVLKNNNISIDYIPAGIGIRICDVNLDFISAYECARFLIDCEIAGSLIEKSVASNILKVANGQRGSYKGLKFIKI